jgi:hypothetical protein
MKLHLRVQHGRSSHSIESESIDDMKQQLEALTQVPVQAQKLLYKGKLLTELMSMQEENPKIVLMGSTLSQIMQVTSPPVQSSVSSSDNFTIESNSAWSREVEHEKVLKQRPEQLELAEKGMNSPLPNLQSVSFQGMINKLGQRVRFTFRRDLDQVWLVTNESTQQLMKGMIRDVLSQPIHTDPDYHILALKLGPTEKSNYYIYWVPCQYVRSLKSQLLSH